MARAKALPIARRLTARTDIKSADKPLLIEVCSLYHNGGRGVCDATNKHFAERLGEAKETISRRLSRLAAAGWLIIDDGKSAGFARTIVPATQCLACYLDPEELTALTQKSIAIDPKINSPLLTESGIAIDQNADPLLTIYGGAIDYLANSFLIVLEVAIKEQEELALKKQACDAANAAMRESQKKIADLEAENRQLKADLLRLVPPVAATPQKPAATPRLTTYRDYDGAWPEQFPVLFDTPAFLAAWSQWGKYLAELGKPHRGHNHEQTDLAELGRKAAGNEQRAIAIITESISAGWKRLIDHKPDAGVAKPKFGQAAPTPTRAGGSPSQAAAYRPR